MYTHAVTYKYLEIKNLKNTWKKSNDLYLNDLYLNHDGPME